MPESFVLFRTISFSNQEAKNTLEQLLKDNAIPYEIIENVLSFDISYANNEFAKDYNFKLKPEDFDKVNKLLEKQTESVINELPADYYLFSFTNDELIEVINKADEWNEIDVQLATKLLNERGIATGEKELNLAREKRMEELAQHTAIKKRVIVAGYIAAMLSGALVFPLFGYAIYIGFGASLFGLVLAVAKKTLPDGKKMYTYAPDVRKHGYRIFVLGIVCTICWVYFVVTLMRS
jgi:hypothetical protein